MADFLSDYWEYLSCYEIPRSYALWSAVGLLGATCHRKLRYDHGHIEFHSNMYIGLIGPPNQKKSTSNDFARDLFTEVCPDLKMGPSRTSPEKIVEIMSENNFGASMTNWMGEQILVKPYAFFINEFKNFLGRSPIDMINFITDIYDRKFYPSATIVRGAEDIINPALNIIMCETPGWFINSMKGDLITGGIARRFVLVYETVASEAKPFIIIPPTAVAARERLTTQLKHIRGLTGLFKWGGAEDTYEKWYRANHARSIKEPNQVMQGYLGSKNVQLYKVMMLLDACSPKPMFTFNKDNFEHALFLLDSVEPNMPRLSLAAGRNEMIGPQQKILDLLEAAGGWLPEKQLKREIESQLTPTETSSVLRHLEDSDQVVKKLFGIPNSEGKEVERWMILLPAKYLSLTATKSIVVEPKHPKT